MWLLINDTTIWCMKYFAFRWVHGEGCTSKNLTKQFILTSNQWLSLLWYKNWLDTSIMRNMLFLVKSCWSWPNWRVILDTASKCSFICLFSIKIYLFLWSYNEDNSQRISSKNSPSCAKNCLQLQQQGRNSCDYDY